MPNTFTTNTFATTYKDDFIDSDNYHRILFNAGRALQARELTQMQTIIQEEIARFGRNIFKDGGSVNPGGPTMISGGKPEGWMNQSVKVHNELARNILVKYPEVTHFGFG